MPKRFWLRPGRWAEATLALALCAQPALADSCWTHNGSIMRLGAHGEKRAFAYEVPRAGLAAIGVAPGDTLFWGVTDGRVYRGQAKLFSVECPGERTSYEVAGPISANGARVTLRGRREIYDRCAPTGRFVTDTLMFDYARQC